jgi:hypothetical protein
MAGTVTVAAASNPPPSVSITNPAGGSTFAAPWTATIQAMASDMNGMITNVDFYTNSALAGRITSAPYNLTLNNLAAGLWALKAVAADSFGASSTSAVVNVTVVTPVPILLTNAMHSAPSRFTFSYSANPGLRYVVQKGTALTNLTGILTNIAASSSVNYTDSAAILSNGFYRVGRLPNP